MDDKLLFFSTFIKYPREIGSVVPSSKFLIKEILKNIDFKTAKHIVEYGAGTGCITIELLKRSRPGAKILCLERNKKFCKFLKDNIKDKRLIVINDSAENIKKYLKKFNIGKVDYIVSGLPFSSLKPYEKYVILEEAKNNLRNNGKFVVYQFLSNLRKYVNYYFSKISIKFVPLNLPPCFVYVCEK